MKKAIGFIQKCVEEYIPICSFSILFIVFIVQILFRYVLRNPLGWAYEVTVSCYLWTVMFGACLATRKKTHVKFTMIYDMLKPKGKAIMSFLSDLIIAAAFCIMFVPTIKFIGQMKIQGTAFFKIGLNIIYLPFIPFMVLVLIYTFIEMYESFMVFSGLGGEKAVQKLISENKSEVEQAIEASQDAQE